jgi:hypothetical protein
MFEIEKSDLGSLRENSFRRTVAGDRNGDIIFTCEANSLHAGD